MSLSDVAADLDAAGYRRDRPWLLASNRKLRHLHGVSVRNVVVVNSSSSSSSSTRPRGKTIDDDEIPNTLQSPSKILSLSEKHAVHHSRSYTDLPRVNGGSHENRKLERQGSRRRRSTLPWNDPNPHSRQIKLEEITKSRMADAWFSIHCDGIESPVYVSEVVEKSTNPSFRSFDVNMCGPLVSRLDHFTLKLWAKAATMNEYVLLVELQLYLQSLQFLGKSLDNFHHPLPINCILFHFSDGVYTNLTDLPPVWAPPSIEDLKSTSLRDGALPTSSYDALMRLANLDECVQDALATRERLESQIKSILEKNRQALDTISCVSRARDKLSLAKHAVMVQKKQLRATVRHKEGLLASLRARKEAMERGRLTQEKARSHLPDARSKLASSAKLLEKATEDSRGQLRRISEDLLAIYPIEPIPGKPLAFTITGLALPNSTFTDIDRDSVAAAVGYTAHLVYLLSLYLSVPLPYPISPYLSNSSIQDPISLSLPQRTYPLYPVNASYRFEYGVFLLNKDIEFLMSKQGLRILDIRHTLPNLKYLLYVLTAGSSEIPARKAGGIRGLFPGRLTPGVSRRGSEDSVESVYSRKVVGFNTKPNDGTATVDKGKRPETPLDATSYARAPSSSRVA
ncbi:hypothetical protein MPDQ_002230 [Monascus purpureus]|uniref:UV radiation resistance protein n=1 Tax=Monascus purpureus TaxID=5098 RepID=A0A507QKS3_MONPU|nr:hypothetical protein MPDQ_002230 [Monascus purpureus]BDD54916.1 hypothetical protein MAP00_000487 [Monascus purpureus]